MLAASLPAPGSVRQYDANLWVDGWGRSVVRGKGTRGVVRGKGTGGMVSTSSPPLNTGTVDT